MSEARLETAVPVTDVIEVVGKVSTVEEVTLTEDEDVLSAIYNENGFEIVTRAQVIESEEDGKLTEKQEEISENTPTVKSNTEELVDVEDEIKTENEGVKEGLQRSDSKETSPFVFPETIKTPEPKEDPLAKLLDPSPTKPQNLSKKTSTSTQSLLNKTRKQNLSTESLQSSRIPRASGHLGRSVSMYSPRVTNPVPPRADKTPVKKPVQKIPHLIHAQRRPGGLLKRSISMSVPKKKATEMAEGMTLVLAVPVTRTTQNVHRSSGDGSQPFIISPYQEEHVLAATCPISGITRHIKIIL